MKVEDWFVDPDSVVFFRAPRDGIWGTPAGRAVGGGTGGFPEHLKAGDYPFGPEAFTHIAVISIWGTIAGRALVGGGAGGLH